MGSSTLDNVDLIVRAGEIVSLIGPNGGGKTSLLRVLLGLVRADSGCASVSAGVRVGYMPQRLFVDPVLLLTVERFLELGGADRAARATALGDAGVGDILGSPMQAISGGELQRVLLA